MYVIITKHFVERLKIKKIVSWRFAKISFSQAFHLGINVKGVLNAAALVRKKIDKGSRATQVNSAANHLEEALEMQKELKTGPVTYFLYAKCLFFQKKKGIRDDLF